MSAIKPLLEVTKDYRTWATSDHPRIPLGYPMFDGRTNGGAALGEVILFQARSSVGKTTFALNVVANNPERACAFFSLEMNGRYLVPRLAAMYTGTPTEDIEKSMMAGETCQPVLQTVEAYQNLVVADEPGMSLKQMAALLPEASTIAGQKVEMVIIDYLELIGGVPGMATLDKIDGVTRKLKDFARYHDVVVLVLHQVGREAGGAGAAPLDITSGRYGGETQADYVLGAYRPCLRTGISQEEYLSERWHWYLQFLKTRGGSEIHPAGLLHQYNPHTMRITEWQHQTAAMAIFEQPDAGEPA